MRDGNQPRAEHRAELSRRQRPSLVPFDGGAASSVDPDAVARAMAASADAPPGLILWDLLGSCNLRCPSCPVGNMPETANAKGMITDELFHRILKKLTDEFPRSQLHFYNWTEPLIHPRINLYCKAAADAGFHLHLSSNLNFLKDEKSLLTAGVKTIRISLSGFTQSIYEQGHRGGNIEKVKANMRRLSAARAATRSRTKVHVYYHKYRHNLHEMPLMEAYAKELGFEFIADWAFLMPVEKLLAYADGIGEEDHRRFAAEAIVPDPRDALAIMQPHAHQPCTLIDQLVLDHLGNVTLCCAVYDAKATTVGHYLDMSWADLQRRKYGHGSCGRCMHYGAHVLYTHFHQPELRQSMLALADSQMMDAENRHHRLGDVGLPVLRSDHLAKSA